MKINLYRYAFLLIVILSASSAFAQEKNYQSEFCRNNNSNGDKVFFNEVRESTMPGGGQVNVDARRNGGIRVRGENRSDILVRACIQTWANSGEAARALTSGIRIETGATIRAEGASDENNWSVSYEILVPRTTDLKLTAHNGGIRISSVEGAIAFETTNGGVYLSEIAGDVKGKTTNGGVRVELNGGGWKGSGLDVETSNGGVQLSLPENYAARIETGTTNGGFKSDFAALNVEKPSKENGWNRRSRVTADLNGGGAPIRVVTTNGGIRITSSADKTR